MRGLLFDMVAPGQVRPYYEGLDEADRQLYDQILQAMLTHSEGEIKPAVSGVDFQRLQLVWECCRHDVPEELHFSRSPKALLKVAPNGEAVSDEEQEVLSFSLGYRHSIEEHAACLRLMEEVSRDLVREANAIRSTRERIAYVHDWFARSCLYENKGRTTDHNAYGALVQRRAVCEGFAAAFKYACDRTGIKCLVVDGNCEKGKLPAKAFDGSHAWNMVYVGGGQAKHIDVSHDVCRSTAGSKVSRKYFLLDSDQIIRNNHEFFRARA